MERLLVTNELTSRVNLQQANLTGQGLVKASTPVI